MRLRLEPLGQLTLVKIRELLREPEALFWVFVFPLLLAVILGVAFRRPAEPEPIRIGVEAGPGAGVVERALAAAPDLDVRLLEPAEAAREITNGRVALVVLPAAREGGEPTYWYDPARPESRLAELAVDDALERAAGRPDPVVVRHREVTEQGSRYIDFLIPGLLGMSFLGTGLWGVGYYIVDARSKQRLKHLMATPMRRTDFLLAQILGRMVFLVPEAAVILGTGLLLGVPVRGSWLLLGLICLLAGVGFSGLGLLLASRPRTVEGLSGLMNLVLFPMWVGSGVFFSTARFPDAVQPLVQALPLTAVIDALRAVMLDGAGLVAVGGELAIAGAWAVGSFALALALFRWR